MSTRKMVKVLIPLFILALALSASLVGAATDNDNLQIAPLNPNFADKVLRPTANDGKMGYHPGPVAIPASVAATTRRPIYTAFPASYDLRTLGKVTPIKDQGACGSCWTFGTCGSLESVLLPGENSDFSENNLKNTSGFALGHCDGGNAYMSTAYLARWSGPVAESSDPYNPASSYSPPGLSAVKHVQKVVFEPLKTSATDNNNLKQALMDNGALYCAFYWTANSYNATTAAYCYTGNSAANHAVTLVGWDDNYSKTNFARAPKGNGAFIVKNSWGTSWGQNGYFYVSYYDSTFGFSENAQFFAEPTTNYSRIYQYDPLGWVTSLGYGNSTAHFANVFTAAANGTLQAVSTYTPVTNASYEIKVYTGVTGAPNTGTLRLTQTGTLAKPGYFTIPLTTGVALTSGQKFSIIIKLITTGYNYPIPMEMPQAGYSTGATASAGQSYVSSTGTTWTDITGSYANTNVCVKGFAN